ncbi:DUF3052 family protein [Streptomyces sp. f150]|uniref:DUF3052 family protein n=1 Tax=Streptomyces sp. f150 TaxID=1827699 RepID=UPI0015CF24F2|nr:DUF3052 family protein [Streptomyces sp. f150]
MLEISDPIDFDDQAQALRKAIEARTSTPLESAYEGLVYGGAECDTAVAWWREGERSLNEMLVRLREEYPRENDYVLLITPAEVRDGHWDERDLGLAGRSAGVCNLGKKPYRPEGATWVASILLKQKPIR